MKPLTAVQERCWRALHQYHRKHGYSPTRKELAHIIGQKSVNGVNQIIVALSKKGYVQIYPPRSKRNLIITVLV